MAINLKNYTTVVTATSSIQGIEKLLMEFGATNIMKSINSGKVESISFMVTVDTVPFAFKLPADVKACFSWLKKKMPKKKDHLLLDQAERIAWKQQHEWLHITLTGIELAQINKIQALMPHSYDPVTGQTLFEKMKSTKFQLLLPSPKN